MHIAIRYVEDIQNPVLVGKTACVEDDSRSEVLGVFHQQFICLAYDFKGVDRSSRVGSARGYAPFAPIGADIDDRFRRKTCDAFKKPLLPVDGDVVLGICMSESDEFRKLDQGLGAISVPFTYNVPRQPSAIIRSDPIEQDAQRSNGRSRKHASDVRHVLEREWPLGVLEFFDVDDV
jgi:hypothetical protein